VNTEAKSSEDPRSTGKVPEPARQTESPSGIDLRPEPERAVRISKRAGAVIVLLGAAVLGLFAFGGWKREQRRTQTAQGSPYKKVEPAKADEVQKELSASVARDSRTDSRRGVTPASPDAEATQLQRSDPTLPSERVVVRNAPPPRTTAVAVAPSVVAREPSPEERAVAIEYAAEQRARLAPTGIRVETHILSGGPQSGNGSASSATTGGVPALEAIARGLAARNSGTSGSVAGGVATEHSEYDEQNFQAQKEAFLEKARLGNTQEYLKYTRIPPLSRFEIKAGWEIPAALEQALNSDLPGELKALVMSNVYDTATGLYLLIPQGSRLVGAYNSRVGYGQNGVQVAWRRVIFPDGSSIDLDGMEGLDSHGNAGLRDKVDHHYQRLFGFAVLTSMFDAALAITQSRQQSTFLYPSPSQEAESAAGREVSQLGTQLTRKNLNAQPTIRIPAGYKFNVRVNRDILFEAPYGPLAADVPAVASRDRNTAKALR
jgi:type IV secretion system protein VirB10